MFDATIEYEKAKDSSTVFRGTSLVRDECRGGAMCILDSVSDDVLSEAPFNESESVFMDRIKRSIDSGKNLFVSEWGKPTEIDTSVMY